VRSQADQAVPSIKLRRHNYNT